MEIYIFLFFTLVFCQTSVYKTKTYLESSYTDKDSNGAYKVEYKMDEDNVNRVDIDDTLGVKEVKCESEDRIIISFNQETEAKNFYEKIKSDDYNTNRVYITSVKYNCSDIKSDSSILILKIKKSEIASEAVKLDTAEAYINEIVKNFNANISVDNTCFGVNVNKTCTPAKTSFPLHIEKELDVACSNCYSAVQFNFSFEIDIEDSLLKRLYIRMKDIKADSSLIMDMYVHNKTLRTIEKNYDHLSFDMFKGYKGSIPFHLSCKIFQDLIMEEMTDTRARIMAGTTTSWKVDEISFTWTPDGSNIYHTDLESNWRNTLDGRGTFKANANLSMIHSINIYAEKLINMNLSMKSEVKLNNVIGDRNKEKTHARLDYALLGNTSIKIIANDEQYGPYPVLKINKSEDMNTDMY